MTSQKRLYRRCGGIDVFTSSTSEVTLLVAVVLGTCLVSLASAAAAPDDTHLNMTTTSDNNDDDDDNIVISLTTSTETDPVTTADMDITTQNNPGMYDGVAVTSVYDDDATEVPTTMTTDTNNDGLSSGWEDPSGASDGRQNEMDQLAEDRDMMQAFYERYNSTTSEVDLVFVLDRSGSVPRKGWQSIVEFVKSVLEHFTVDRHNTRVAVVTYSTTASIDINDLEPGPTTDHENKCTLYGRIDRHVARRTPYGYTATHEALQRATQVLVDSRPMAKKAVIVITDGKSNIGPPPVRVAVDLLRLRWSSSQWVTTDWNEELYGPQVEIYAFGVADANPTEMRSIASNLPGHLFTMSTFKLFEQFAKSIHGDKQETHWIPADVGDCPETCTGSHAHCMCGSKVGAYACICDPGYNLIDSQCVPCEKGFYKERLSPDLCSQCPENTTTNHEASTSMEQCKPLPGHVRCPPLPIVEHSRSFYVEGDIGDEVADTGVPCDRVTDGNSCHYLCETGYRLTGPPVLTCNYSGHWDGDVPQCQIVDCHPIDSRYQALVGATVHYLNDSTTYGSSVVASCRRGTIGVGRTIWECDQNGLWTYPADFQCHAVFCHALPLAGQLETSTDECRDQNVPVDSVCQLRCGGTGFQLTGPSEFKCTFDVMTMVWTPSDNWPTCKDIHPPKIVCPKDIDVTVAEPGDNTTIVHYDVQKPQAIDNSGLVYYRVLGVPNLANHAFPIGYTMLTYEAHDETGNKAFCHQYVHVRARTVEVHNCPDNISATATSLRRSTFVEWDAPIFVGADGSALRHECSVKSGSEFGIGSSHVICYAPEYPRVSCQFHVNVVYPPCPIPFEDDPPANGALICGVMGHHYPRACRIHCREGYELRRYDAAHKFVCQWDGTWTIDGPWPDCFQSRRPTKAITENQLYIRYQGSCSDVRGTIAEAFVQTMSRLLDEENGPCPPGFLCNVEEVRVLCGVPPVPANQRTLTTTLAPRRRRRHVEEDNEADEQGDHTDTAVVMLVTSAQLLNSTNSSSVSDRDRDGVMTALDGLSEAVWRQVIDAGLGDGSGHGGEAAVGDLNSAEAALEQLIVTEMTEVSRQWETIACREGEVLENDGISTVCYLCPPGSYRSHREQCELCSVGTYQSRDGSTRCEQCPRGTTTARTGSQDIDECKSPCHPGYHSSNGLEPCVPCAVGTFQNVSGSTECNPCPLGSPLTSPSLVATSVTHCYEYVNCGSHNVTCDVIAGFRCTLYARHYDDVAQAGDVSKIRCVCEADDGCPPVVTMAISDDATTESTSNIIDGNDDEDDIDENEWTLPLNDSSPSADRGEDDFDLVFRYPSTTMRWIMTSLLNEFAACMWLRPARSPALSSQVAVLSLYKHASQNATSQANHNNRMTIVADVGGSNELPAVSTDQTRVNVVVRQGVWNHLCVSWTRVTGYWRFHINGTSSTATSTSDVYSPLVGDYLRRGSMLVLGEQFTGELTQFHVYDRVITDHEASEMASTRNAKSSSGRCRPVEEVAGTLLPWRRIMPLVTSSSRVIGYVTARNRSRCLVARGGDDDNSLLSDACNPSTSAEGSCLNGGACRLDTSTAQFVCECPVGFSGRKCEMAATTGSGDPCVHTLCLNGGICVRDRQTATCRCPENWTGKHCQVSRAPASCAMNPCVNNGTCIDVISGTSDGHPSYRCICPQQEAIVVAGGLGLTVSLVIGANCEHLSVCDSMPCGRHGTCVTLINTDLQDSRTRGGSSIGYRCICDAGFQGTDCSTPTSLALQPTAVKQTDMSRDHVKSELCAAVDCQNGGTCENNEFGFQCICPRDYTGKYCSVVRHTDTKRYRVTVTLKVNDSNDIYYDSTFHEFFRLQIHDLFGDLTGDNKLYIIIDDIRVKRDAVAVDFFLIFSRYVDTAMFTSYDVTRVFERHLATNRIGKLAATRDGFALEEMRAENEVAARHGSIDVIRDVMLCVMAGVAMLFLVVVLILREWRRHKEDRPISAVISRLNVGQTTVENNYVIANEKSRVGGKQLPDDVISAQCHTQDDVISEGIDKLPNVDNFDYKWPSKRGENINVYREMDQHIKRTETLEQLLNPNDNETSVNFEN